MSAIQYKLTYRDPKNVLWIARITDSNNPYNIQYSVHDNGNGTITVTFTFSPLPAGTLSTAIGWSTDGVNWSSQTGGTTSPRSITLPSSVYYYSFTLHLPTGPVTYYLNTPETVNVVKGAADSIRVSWINNEEDKFSVIRAKQAVIKVISTAEFNLNNFAQGNVFDGRFYVEISVNTDDNIVFKGYLQMNDLSEAFLSPSNMLTLTATDKLGSLKKIPMVNFSGTNVSGYYTIAKYIAFCLRKTGMKLKINVISNLREEHDTTQTWFNTVYLWSKTFEDQIGSCVNSYGCLELILKKHGVLWQRNGEWWIKAVDEYDQHDIYITQFDEYGESLGEMAGTSFYRSIKRELPIYLSQRRTTVFLNGQHKYAKLTYRYELPKEIICNIDYSRGDFIANISSNIKKYALDCWTLYQGRPNVPATGSTAFIERIFNSNNYESERFIVIDKGALYEYQLGSESIDVNEKDKFDLGFDVKYDGQIETAAGSITGLVGQVRLYADDGTYYTLNGGHTTDPTPYWIQCTADFNTFQKYFWWEGDGTDDDTQWRSVGFWNGADCPPIPKSGKIRIFFTHNYKVDQFQLHVSNIRFDYFALVNGSYKKWTGQYNQVTQIGDFNDVTEDEIYISDSPCRLYKGALLRKSGDNYLLAGRFYHAGVFHSGVPGDEYFHPFSYIQIFSVFNQVKQLTRTFRAGLQGLDAASLDSLGKCDMPDLLPSYRILDASLHTQNKDLMMLSADMNTKWSDWTGTLKEVYNRATGKFYNDSWEQKYIS